MSIDTHFIKITITYFIYQFIFFKNYTLYFNLNFIIQLKINFIISHSRRPFILLLYIATLSVVHQTYREETILLFPMPL